MGLAFSLDINRRVINQASKKDYPIYLGIWREAQAQALEEEVQVQAREEGQAHAQEEAQAQEELGPTGGDSMDFSLAVDEAEEDASQSLFPMDVNDFNVSNAPVADASVAAAPIVAVLVPDTPATDGPVPDTPAAADGPVPDTPAAANVPDTHAAADGSVPDTPAAANVSDAPVADASVAAALGTIKQYSRRKSKKQKVELTRVPQKSTSLLDYELGEKASGMIRANIERRQEAKNANKETDSEIL